MADENVPRALARLGAELRRIRRRAGVAQGAVGNDEVPIDQSAASRIELGRRRPRQEQVDRWLALAEPEDRERAEALWEAAQRETRTYDELLAGATTGELQTGVEDEDRAATLLRAYSPVVLPGLLQTPEYARAVFELGQTDVAASVDGRMRRQRILYEPGRRFEFLIPQRLLDCDVAPQARIAQLHHLAAVAGTENVRLGVVPTGQVPVLAWTGFVLRTPADGEPEYATVELIGGRYRASDNVLVEKYRATWDRLAAVAETGPDAARLIYREAG